MSLTGPEPAVSTGAAAERPRVYRGERLAPLLMLAPAVVVLLALVIGPVVFLIDTALYRQNLFQVAPPRFVGTDNFYYLFTSQKFHTALARMFVFAFTALGAEFVLGFVLAAWVHRLRDLPGMSIVRTLLTTPILVAPIVAAVMWRFMYQPDFGVINYMLGLVGIPKLGWLSDADIALFAIVAIDVWQWTPFVFLIVLAGMYAVPRSLYEAAELDGTSLWRQIFLITIPLIKRVLVIVLLLRLIDLLRAFEVIVATTQGGPGDASYTLPVLIWETAFVNFQMGDAAATSLVLLAVVSIVITLLIRAISRQGVVGQGRG
ncbi:MAG: carbohydrate ABC transporter permease [Alphaproteobacteria bacterium]